MNKRYIIYSKHGIKQDTLLKLISTELSEAYDEDFLIWTLSGYAADYSHYYYDKALKQYGLIYKGMDTYEVIDEQLFGLFLLEFSDVITVKDTL